MTYTIAVTEESYERIQRALPEQGARQRNLASESSNEGMRKSYSEESKKCYELATNIRHAKVEAIRQPEPV